MALAANKSRDFRRAGSQRFKVGVSQTIYKGAAVGLRSDGLVYEWDASTGDHFLGFSNQKVVTDGSGIVTKEGVPTGYNDNSTESGYVSVLQPDRIVEGVSVTGVDANNDTGKPVWMTDDDTFTLTPQANLMPVGYVIAVVSTSSGTADVAIFTYDQMGAALMTDHGFQEQTLVNAFDASKVTTSFASLVASKPALGSGLGTKLLVIMGDGVSGLSGTMKFKLKIGSTFVKNTAGTFIFAITGGTMTQGAVKTVNLADSTTNPASFGPGDAITVQASAATAPAAGQISVILHSARRLAG